MKIKLVNPRVAQGPTDYLQACARPRARSNGSFQDSLEVALRAARRDQQTYYVYATNSYMRLLWRVSARERDYLCPVSAVSTWGALAHVRVFRVCVDGEVTVYDVERVA